MIKPRYEIRPHRTEIYRSLNNGKSKGHKPTQFYGVWDLQKGKWVVNAAGIGKKKAERILKALLERE